ncbi:resuscitation-promoting factor [Puerhibacterium puerhi]|uniref:resuscitation-promoting factor n=1 Tax=Puerhibacterium puerhi TaxID=2692623 RepID=UPI001916B93B|nr:resuscitation-promoting factor [Puerhibacterium puerhi]
MTAPNTETRTAARRRRWPWVAGLAAAAVATGGAVAYADARKTVTLDVDGTVTTVTTFAGSVEGLLDAQGVRVGERDAVAPDATSSLRDGAEIVVRYGRQVTLQADGDQADIWVTALDAGEALDRFASRGGDVRLVASRSGERASLPLRLAHGGGPVAVVADGETRTTKDTGQGVDALLRSVDVAIDGDDRVSVATPEAVGVPETEAEVAVVVQRVETKDVTTETPIPFETVTREDPERFSDLEPEVTQEGVEGVHTVVERVTTVDGKEESRELVSEGDTTPPVDEIVVEGTKERPEPEPEPEPAAAPERSSSTASDEGASGTSDEGSSGGSDEAATGSAPTSGVWAALAQCESGGNPATNTGNGYYGLYQFTVSTWQSVGGSGLPSEASAAEQTQRAQILQERAGWGQWPACARKLGLM